MEGEGIGRGRRTAAAATRLQLVILAALPWRKALGAG
jgi:hypothetical protein